MTEPKRYLINPVVSCRDEGDEALLFNPDLDDVALINPTGRMIWDILATPYTVGEIASQLAERTNASAETIAPDVEQFLQTLLPDFILEVS